MGSNNITSRRDVEGESHENASQPSNQESQDENKHAPWWRRKHQLAGIALGIGVGTAVGISMSTLISGILVGIAITITFVVAYPRTTATPAEAAE